jgi:methylenetetrahydrofolate--tRNA-(uracil-5-)-methyltransferase
MTRALHIVGGGMAGSEAAWQAAELGVPVILHEMRPKVGTFAHRTGNLAEMVCSNSFRSDDDEQNAVGLLHWEMRAAGGLIMATADQHRLPAGGALAVDRDPFAEAVTERLMSHPNITVEPSEITELPSDGDWIFATGPLTSGTLAAAIARETGQDSLAFFDAIAPIVYADSIDMSVAWEQSRYDKGDTEAERTAYINCPMTKDRTTRRSSTRCSPPRRPSSNEGETAQYFDGCLPIEVMAERGRETLRFGPMKPIGLTNPHDPARKPYAVVQLRRDNKLGTLYNIVGFQTKMKYGAQTDVFRKIPACTRHPLRGWAEFTATPSSTRPHFWTKKCACGHARTSALPGRSPASRVMSKAPRWGFWPGAWLRPRSSERRFPRFPRPRQWAP